jgi:DNA-binding CsgD family transcriptional regulator
VNDDHTRTRQVSALPLTRREVHLDILVDGQPTRRVALTGDTLVIGRSRDAELRLDVEGVSRKHARITRAGQHTLSLVDLGAKNGTFLNGERVDIAALHHGDRVQIGPVLLCVQLTEPGDAASAGAPVVVAPVTPGATERLSAREQEVARYVAQGLTNAEIAELLGVAKRTVATHLERIYERLGIHSRAALAHLVARGGELGP